MIGARLRLVVDPTRCDGSGLCAELLPEWVSLDEWSFPIMRAESLEPRYVELARRAVQTCPKLALSLVEEA